MLGIWLLCNIWIQAEMSMKIKAGPNFALRRPAYSSSTSHNGDPSLAVDGNSNPDRNVGRSCAATLAQLHPWWAVDLQRPRRVTAVEITNRLRRGDTQEDLKISVGYHNKTGRNKICQFYVGPLKSAETRRFECNNPIFGRFVFIQRTSNSTDKFSICEVKVFGNDVPNVARSWAKKQESGSVFRGPRTILHGKVNYVVQCQFVCMVTPGCISFITKPSQLSGYSCEINADEDTSLEPDDDASCYLFEPY